MEIREKLIERIKRQEKEIGRLQNILDKLKEYLEQCIENATNSGGQDYIANTYGITYVYLKALMGGENNG